MIRRHTARGSHRHLLQRPKRRPQPPTASRAGGLALTAGVLIAALTGCSSPSATDGGSPQPSSPSGSAQPSSPAGSATPSTPATGNGTLFAILWGESQTTATAHPVAPDGALGEGRTVISSDFEGTDFDGVVDGLGDLVLTGSFTSYWTTKLVLQRGTQELSTTPAKGWCGGEDLMAICHLLDEKRIVRTTVIGERDKEPKVLVSSLADGETLKEHGPFKGLTMMLPTAAPDSVMLFISPTDANGDPSGQASLLNLDLGSGQTTPLGEVPDGWTPLCAVGSDSAVGYTDVGDEQRAAAVGSATVGDVSWSREDTIAGCSADGRFVYVQQIPAPPKEENDSSEGKNPPSNVERISLADGQRSPVLTLAGSEIATMVTR